MVSCGIPYRGCSWQVGKTDVGMSCRFLGCFVEGVPWMGGWNQVGVNQKKVLKHSVPELP